MLHNDQPASSATQQFSLCWLRSVFSVFIMVVGGKGGEGDKDSLGGYNDQSEVVLPHGEDDRVNPGDDSY